MFASRLLLFPQPRSLLPSASLLALPTLLSPSPPFPTRLFSSSPPLPLRSPLTRELRESILINKSLVAAQGDYCALLSIFSSDHLRFNDVCYATLMSRLGRLRGRNAAAAKRDERYRTLVALLPAVVQKGGVRQVANIAHALAKLGERREGGAVLDVVEARADWLANTGSPQNISNTAWAFATLNKDAPALFRAIDSRAEWLADQRNPQSIADTAWAFAKLNIDAPNLFPAIASRADWFLNQSTPRAIANTAWAFAKLDKPAPSLFSAIDARADWVVNEGSPRTISNTAWAFAKLKQGAPNLLAAIESRADRLANRGNSQDISNIAWAFATHGVDAPAFFSAIDARADGFVKASKPQEIANTAWAFAKLRRDGPKLFSEIDARADWFAKEGKPQEVASTAWAFATLNKDAPALLSAIESRADWFASESKPQEIANTAWAFATLGRDAPALVLAVDSRADWFLNESSPQNVANTAWAFAELGTDAPNFWSCLERRREAFAAQASPQNICNTAWALAIAGRAGTNSELLRVLWAKAISAGEGELSNENLNQLVQVGLHAKGDVRLQSPPKALVQMMLDAASSQSNASSDFEGRVARRLAELGVEYTREYPAFGAKLSGLLSVDFAVQPSDVAKTAIECDGPSHYLRGSSGQGKGRENGRTAAKRRLLERRGWRVINVPWYEEGEELKQRLENALNNRDR